jgi:hypothetical protein
VPGPASMTTDGVNLFAFRFRLVAVLACLKTGRHGAYEPRPLRRHGRARGLRSTRLHIRTVAHITYWPASTRVERSELESWHTCSLFSWLLCTLHIRLMFPYIRLVKSGHYWTQLTNVSNSEHLRDCKRAFDDEKSDEIVKVC